MMSSGELDNKKNLPHHPQPHPQPDDNAESNPKNPHQLSFDESDVFLWGEDDVRGYLLSRGHSPSHVTLIVDEHKIDGKALLLLNQDDIKELIGHKPLGDVKRILHDINVLKGRHQRRRSRRRRQKLLLPQRRQVVTFSHQDNSSTEEDDDQIDYDERHFSSSSASSVLNIDDDDYDDVINLFPKTTTLNESLQQPATTTAPSTGTTPPSRTNNNDSSSSCPNLRNRTHHQHSSHSQQQQPPPPLLQPPRLGGYAVGLRPELFKAVLAMAYLFVVTWITALVMVIVHDRVPDMEKYPPLPDLFLDNMPHIPWAFEMCEVTGTILFTLWISVLVFHKHRFILIRRFFALSGTVFLLRCVTMLITSLSVPGTHLKCNPRPYGDWMSRGYNAYLIWKGAGMSIQGVRTCGDYMFSGHTVALTMLNFFVTEYTPRRLYFIHTFSWLLNMFGIFFILAAHEHYSIDVFIAFYITSRLFLYYHTLANNHALRQKDSRRTKVWFPLFSYFESGVCGIVPNVYEWPLTPRRVKKLFRAVSSQLERRYKATFFTRRHDSRSFGLFRTKTNPFIKPINTKDQ